MTDELTGINEMLDERRRELAEAESTATAAAQALQSLEAEQRQLYRNQAFSLEQRQQRQAALGAQSQQHQRAKQHAQWRARELTNAVDNWMIKHNQRVVDLHNAEHSLTYQTNKLLDLERQLAFQRATVEREQAARDKAQTALAEAMQQPVAQVPAYPPPDHSHSESSQPTRYYNVVGTNANGEPISVEVNQDGSPLLVVPPQKPQEKITK